MSDTVTVAKNTLDGRDETPQGGKHHGHFAKRQQPGNIRECQRRASGTSFQDRAGDQVPDHGNGENRFVPKGAIDPRHSFRFGGGLEPHSA